MCYLEVYSKRHHLSKFLSPIVRGSSWMAHFQSPITSSPLSTAFFAYGNVVDSLSCRSRSIIDGVIHHLWQNEWCCSWTVNVSREYIVQHLKNYLEDFDSQIICDCNCLSPTFSFAIEKGLFNVSTTTVCDVGERFICARQHTFCLSPSKELCDNTAYQRKVSLWRLAF